MILREFLYVDTDKVRSLLAQLEGGVAEEQRVSDTDAKKLSLGLGKWINHEQNWGGESYIQRSFADGIFPTLEDALDSEQVLIDISDKVVREEFVSSGEMELLCPPGTLVRISAPAQLFDARYVAQSFAGTALVATGVDYLAKEAESATSPARGKTKSSPQGRQARVAEDSDDLERMVPELSKESILPLSSNYLRSLIRIARGMFHPGLHLAVLPEGNPAVFIGARLQEGRRYLDAEPEILFSRYGLAPQLWTIVGTIGSYAPKLSGDIPDSSADSFITGGRIDRRKFVQKYNEVLANVADNGFGDRPRFPGFSIVPLGVYRLISQVGSP